MNDCYIDPSVCRDDPSWYYFTFEHGMAMVNNCATADRAGQTARSVVFGERTILIEEGAAICDRVVGPLSGHDACCACGGGAPRNDVRCTAPPTAPPTGAPVTVKHLQ
eukprot:gene1808-33303_t